MKTVFPNGMVAHVWAQQNQTEGRSSNGNFSFEGATLYSYSTPIAAFVVGAAGQRVCLITSEKYSITTSGKHMGPAWRAVDYGRAGYPVFCVPFLGTTGGRTWRGSQGATGDQIHQGNLDWMTAQYAETKAKARRSQSAYFAPGAYLKEMADRAVSYAGAFGLPAPSLAWEADANEIIAYREARDAKNNTPAAIAKREREQARRIERKGAKEAAARAWRFAQETERRELWLAGNAAGYYRGNDGNGGALMRIRGDVLETSQGATVPLSHAIRVFRAVKACRLAGTEWRRNGHTLHVGHFQVDHIRPDGSFIAGCHQFNWPEIERVATLAGVAGIATDDGEGIAA